MDVFIGSLMLVPYDFEPLGFVFCDGRILPIARYSALFALLGNQFGGDGKTTFALPDLRGKIPIGAGQGPGLRNYDQAVPGGATTETLDLNKMPPHKHQVRASTGRAGATSAAGALPVKGVPNVFSPAGAVANATLAQGVVAPVGAAPAAAHTNMMPYSTLNWAIAMSGIFPSRP